MTPRGKRRVGRTEGRRRTHSRLACAAGAGRCRSGTGGCWCWAGPLTPQLRAAAGPHPWFPGHGAEGTQSVPVGGEWQRAGPRGWRRPGGRVPASQGPFHPFPPCAGRRPPADPWGVRAIRLCPTQGPEVSGWSPGPRKVFSSHPTVKQPAGSFLPTLRGTPLKLATSLKVNS